MPLKKIRTLIVDNNRLVCFAIKKILTDSVYFEVVETLHCSSQMSKYLVEKNVDLIFITVSLFDDFIKKIINENQNINSEIKFIGLMSDSMAATINQGVCGQFHGLIDREHGMEDLLLVSKLVMKGFQCIPFELFHSKGFVKTAVLTKRERQILDYMKQGMTNRDIASIINISHKTVSVHRYNIMFKMGIKNQMELYRLGGASNI